MTIALVAVALVAVAAVCALIIIVRTLTASQREAQAQWAGERRELLERIQRPERVPAQQAQSFEIPALPPDDWNLVGTIRNDPELYLRADEPDDA